MILKDLEHIIDDKADVAINTTDSDDLPLMFKWAELKELLTDEGWKQPVHKITSYSGILILLEKPQVYSKTKEE